MHPNTGWRERSSGRTSRPVGAPRVASVGAGVRSVSMTRVRQRCAGPRIGWVVLVGVAVVCGVVRCDLSRGTRAEPSTVLSLVRSRSRVSSRPLRLSVNLTVRSSHARRASRSPSHTKHQAESRAQPSGSASPLKGGLYLSPFCPRYPQCWSSCWPAPRRPCASTKDIVAR